MAKQHRDRADHGNASRGAKGAGRLRSGGKHIGDLKPRYKLLLNPFPETRLSRCPGCDRLTYPRKFPLLIHVDGYGPYTQGKTCKYCPRCEIIICHQDELEFEMAVAFEKIDPTVLGNDYLVLGTVETKTWKAGMSRPTSLEDLLAHTADFKGRLDLQFDPGGWRPEGSGPRYLEPHPLNTPWQLARADRKPGKAGASRGSASPAPAGLPSRGPGAARWA